MLFWIKINSATGLIPFANKVSQGKDTVLLLF